MSRTAAFRPLGTPLGGILLFRRGGEVEVSGEVIRTRAGTVALALDFPGISFADILAEQRHLRALGYTLARLRLYDRTTRAAEA